MTTKKKEQDGAPIAREVAVMSATDGSVAIHTLPQSVKTDEDLRDYLHLTLEVSNDSDWIAADKIVLSDFRSGRTPLHCGNCGRATNISIGGVIRCKRCADL